MNFNRFTNYFFRRKSSRRDLAASNDVIEYPEEEEESISSSTPSLRISSAPASRASMRIRPNRSDTHPAGPLLLPAPSSSSRPTPHPTIDARSTPTYYSPPPPATSAELSTPIPYDSCSRSLLTDTIALSCPTMVAIGTPFAYSASSPAPTPTLGLASTRPDISPAPSPAYDPAPSPARVQSCGPTSESNSSRGPAFISVLTSNNSPTFGPCRDSNNLPALRTTHSPSYRPTIGITHASTINPIHGSAIDSKHGSICGQSGSTHGSAHNPAFGSSQGSAYSQSGSAHIPALGSIHSTAFSPTHDSAHNPAFGSTHGSAHSSAFSSTRGPAPLPSSAQPTRDRTPTNEGPCAPGSPISHSTPLIQSPSTPPLPPTPPPPLLEGHPSCSCGRDLEMLRNETRLLRTELTKSKQTISQMKEREKLLRHRLSEQARRQLERGGSAKFEDISLGENRPSQLIRRYGNLYSEGRLDAMDALDELREVTEFNDLKQKLLLSVIVLAFRNARKNLEEMKSQMRHLLHISADPPPPPPPLLGSSNSTTTSTTGGRDPAVTLKSRPLPPSHPVVVELEEIIAVYLRRTLEHQNLSRNFQEVRERVWATLFDFPKLRFCRGLQHYIEECVRLAWALSLQNPPYVVDYRAKTFSSDAHTRFHTSDPDSLRIRSVLWPALREGGDTGPCVYKGVVVT